MTRSVFVLLTLAAMSGVPLLGQSDQKAPAFEVASVKPNTSIDGKRSMAMSPGGRVTFTHAALRDVIWIAYSSNSIQGVEQIVGGPSWVTSEYFDIAAESASLADAQGQAVRERLNLMLKSLMADRFQLRVHIEPRETSVYELMLAKKNGELGAAIHPTTHDCPKEPDCGVRNRGGFVVATGVTIDDIARAFSNFGLVDGPAQNATGLTGRFDFQLKYTPPVPSAPEQVDPRPNADFISNFLTDFQDQLGLKLQREKRKLDFVVIDHVEKPTPD